VGVGPRSPRSRGEWIPHTPARCPTPAVGRVGRSDQAPPRTDCSHCRLTAAATLRREAIYVHTPGAA